MRPTTPHHCKLFKAGAMGGAKNFKKKLAIPYAGVDFLLREITP